MPVFEQFKHPSNEKGRRRRGRGISAGRGKTAGRGQTGQKSRSGGNIHPRFEGGRTPAVRKFGKFGGFKRHRKVYYHAVNLGSFAEADDGTVVDLAYLDEHSLLPKKRRGLRVKLLGDGEFAKKLTFKLHAFSHSAKKRVEDAGGICEVIE
jgi:large subunit ribosomal protein L15